MESEQKSSYRQIFKATGLFGGVQVFNILIGIVRTKLIAILLGPAGMGVVGLLTSTTGIITALTNFGLSTSAVRNVAEASAEGDQQRIGIVVTTLRKLVWLTGLLGAFITLVLSPWLSELTFGNRDYTYAFMFLSVTLLFSQLRAGQGVVLQGTRKLRYIAKSSILGSLSGLLITVPLYFFLGIDGIVPALIISSIASLLLSWYFARKVLVEHVSLSFQDVWKEGRIMLVLGFMLSLSGLATIAVSYFTCVYISRVGGVEQVGLYNAGFTIVGTYVGLIFAAMATDYYPRLAGLSHDNQLAKETINQQAELAILILAPILMVFFVFINWVIQLLYTEEFIQISGMIKWAALGMFFRAPSWAVAFLFIAKGASRLFFVNELIANVVTLGFNVVCYRFWGLDGLGIAFLATYIFYLIQVFVVCNRKYEFAFSKGFLKIFLLQMLCAIVCLCVIKLAPHPYHYISGSVFIVVSGIYCYIELNKRINCNEILRSIIKRNKKQK